MKKLLLLLFCLLFACPALAETTPEAGPLPVAEPLSGVACWPGRLRRADRPLRLSL